MTYRKPDFWVVAKTFPINVQMWVAEREEYGTWTAFRSDRARYALYNRATDTANRTGGRVVPVYCTTRKAEPQMRERSSSWVLKRLAEGKVVLVDGDTVYRLDECACAVTMYATYTGKWTRTSIGIGTNGRVICRIAKDFEVPK